MIICVDITEMANVNFISGIQRVIKEVTTRWIRDNEAVRLLTYEFSKRCFRIVDNMKYLDYYLGKTDKKDYITQQEMRIDDFNENYIFFDMDSVWMNPLKRSYLLPLLKARGTRIAAHIYDVIPITEAQYCHEFTVCSFLEYIGAQIEYADLIIANAQSTIDSINSLISGTVVDRINGRVVKLGSDIKKPEKGNAIKEKIRDIPSKGKYILMVGTIEPRKNHRFVLNAFETALFDRGVNLVFAGREGWNVSELMNDIIGHKELNHRLFYINDASDSDITYLYENALAVAFPSFNEGFGLPIIEAFDRGTPVLAADIPVLRETGGQYCRYFSLANTKEFIDLVELYLCNKEVYDRDKRMIHEFKKTTWDEVSIQMLDVLTNEWIDGE